MNDDEQTVKDLIKLVGKAHEICERHGADMAHVEMLSAILMSAGVGRNKRTACSLRAIADTIEEMDFNLLRDTLSKID